MADDDNRGKRDPRDFVRLEGPDEPVTEAHTAHVRMGFAAALVVCAVLLFTVSLGFVHPDKSGAWSLSWLLPGDESLRTVESDSASIQARETAKKPVTVASGSDRVPEADASEGDVPEKDVPEEGGRGEAPSSNNAPSPSPVVSESAVVPVGPRPDAPVEAAPDTPVETPEEAPAPSVPEHSSASPQTITVNVCVSSDAAGGAVASSGSYALPIGSTPYDALRSLGLSVSSRTSPFGVYVSAIGGLAEKEHGPSSGWMYSVNGVSPNTSCSSYKLQDGDSVSWYYVK